MHAPEKRPQAGGLRGALRRMRPQAGGLRGARRKSARKRAAYEDAPRKSARKRAAYAARSGKSARKRAAVLRGGPCGTKPEGRAIQMNGFFRVFRVFRGHRLTKGHSPRPCRSPEAVIRRGQNATRDLSVGIISGVRKIFLPIRFSYLSSGGVKVGLFEGQDYFPENDPDCGV